MVELSRPVGLGLAARGSVADAVAWAEQARRSGLDSVWVHDSYFERDAVTYGSAIAAQVAGIRVGLGALNPLTRHPVVVAMTVSAIDTMRALWSGERVPPGSPGVPPVQPMFPPVHRVPIYIAAYRSAFLELAGEKADGYLARPAESIASLRKMLATMRAAAVAAGRPEDAVEVAGYLLTLVDSSRREALNRAKREPFVIYMMSVQSDLAMRRAGLDPELKDRIAAAWRAEDYHGAASLIPDELLDAFMLCGTREEVAARAAAYHQAGMDLPLLQPVLQEQDQVREVLAAAMEYGRAAPAAAPVPALAAREGGRGAPQAAPEGPRAPEAPGPRERPRTRLRRRVGAWVEIARPFSFTASTVPVAAAGALAALDRRLDWPLFIGALIAAVLLHVGTNVINEIYDVRKGIDSITSPRASHALLKGRLAEREAFVLAATAFAGAAAIGLWLIAVRGWPVAVLGVIGLIGGFGYTAPPLEYKFRALGPPLVFLLMGPLMVVGAYYVSSGALSWHALLVSLPGGLLVTAILHGNEWRDVSEDARAGISTLSIRAGRRSAHALYLSLVVGAYLVLSLAVAVHALPAQSLLAMLSLPLLVRAIRSSELGASGQQRAIAMIDLETAQLHAAFGFLLVAGIAIAAALR